MDAPLAAARDVIVERSVLLASSGCWFWFGTRNDRSGVSGQYGRIKYKGKLYYAHRLSYLAFNGEIPDGLHVMHLCFNQQCVNPKHLKLGTQQQNIQDGHNNGKYPAKRKPSTLSEQDRKELIELFQSGYAIRFLSRLYNMNYSGVRYIVHNFLRKGGYD